MDGTILGQGSFVAPATIIPVTVQIPSGADFMWVRNYTQSGLQGGASAYGIEYYWQRGMAAGAAVVKYYSNGSAVLNGDTIAVGGFTLYDPSGQTVGSQSVLGNPIAITASTNVQKPVVSTGTTSGLSVGSVVRLSNNGGAAFSPYGIDMIVSAISAGVSFTCLQTSNELATAPGGAGTNGNYIIVNYDPLYYPRHRYITNITQAANAQVSVSVAHQLTVGQEVRFNIPAVSGMVQLNGSSANNYAPAIVVSVVDAYNFTVNVNTTSYTAFTTPTNAQQPSSWPQVVPFGIDTSTALVAPANTVPGLTAGVGTQVYNSNTGILADSTVNTGYLGMLLGTGGNGAISTSAITGPAGSASADVLYWVAGKSTYGGL